MTKMKYGLISEIDKIIRQYKKGLLFINTEEEAIKRIKEQIRCYELIR